MYPFVPKTGAYPFGTPTIITEVFDTNIDMYFGLIQCKILPPRKLRFPVLPTRIDGKLLFVLCLSCGRDKLDECNHNESQRMLEGTFVTEEVKLAVKHGYIVKKIYSVWHWEQIEKYNEQTKQGGLFTTFNVNVLILF